jgi:hypothetical protein
MAGAGGHRAWTAALAAQSALAALIAAGCVGGELRAIDAGPTAADAAPPPADGPCAQEPGEVDDPTCAGGAFVATLDDSGQSIEVTGNIAPAGDVDYIRFQAVDSLDFTCDTYHVRARFVVNPADGLLIDVWKGGCGAAMVCDSVTDFQWYTNFSAGGVGECPCSPTGVNNCADQTAEYVVRVRRKDGAPPSCADYRLEISNGLYPGG